MFRWLMSCFKKIKKKRKKFRLVPVLGVVREQTSPVSPTSEFRGWPTYGELLMAFTLTDTQQVTLSVVITDKKGNPARIDGRPEWLVDNPNLLALDPGTDALSCVVKAMGPLGTAIITFKADADLGPGTAPLIGTLEVEITGGTASNVVIKPGDPAEQP